MSRNIHPDETVLTLEGPLEALRASPAFHGPIEPLDGESCNDHFALIFESPEEQFAASIPFVRQGLERGELVTYIGSDDSRERVLSRMRDADVDVDGALDSGAFVFETARETYLENGEFDVDRMIARYRSAIDAATAEFEALRLVVETEWLLDESVSLENFMEYESRVNDLFDGKDAIALCQYDRETFSAETICDVVRVHPHLIYDGTVCHNFYYTPPEEFCGTDRPTHEADRMLRTLLDRTRAKVELQDRERYMQRQNEITADPDTSFQDKLQDLFELGCERFDLELGAMARIDTDEDWFEVEFVSDDHEHFRPGVELPLSETYCTGATEIRAARSVTDPEADGYGDIFVYEEFGIRAYLGTYIGIEGGDDRAFFFVSSESHDETFSGDEHAFLRTMGQWVKYELEQHQRERELERTVERLEESNERLEQFAYAASHDLQEPLRMVSSYLQLIDQRADEEFTDESQEFLDFAVDGADRMREMIAGLLAYSRIERGGNPLELVDLDAVLADVREDLQLQLEENDAELTVGSLPHVKGDDNQLRQLFQNLVSNAITYSGDSPPRIDVTAERDDGKWVISVTDEGIGIEPADQERIFEIFNRLHTREQYNGTGIGLALCERIVERHDGDIWVESEPGEGARFSVRLPQATTNTPQAL